MHGYSCGIRGHPADGENPPALLGSPINGEHIGELLRNPIQGPQRGHPGGSSTPYHLKMVIDAEIPHWVTLVAGEDAGPDGFGQAVQCVVALFYADDCLLALPRPA